MRDKILFIFSVLIVSSIFLALWMFVPVGAAQQVPGSTAKPKASSPTAGLNVYIPLLANAFCMEDTVESPFSIEIAALHQITTTAANQYTLDSSGKIMSEQQYNAWYTQAYPTLLTALKETGAGYTRVYIKWSDIEPTAPTPGLPPVYDTAFLKWYDDRLVQLVQDGVKIIATIGSAPDWANGGVYGTTGSCPVAPVIVARQPDYQRFLTDIVTHYDQPPYNINHWELFNEADNTSLNVITHDCFGNFPSDYSQILTISDQVIKGIDPTATVLMSGIAYDAFLEYNGPFNRYFPDGVMADNGRNFDVLNFHYFPDYALEWERWNPPAQPPTCGIVDDGLGTPYDGSGIDLIAKKNHFTNRMSTCFGVSKPVWLTELAARGATTDTDSLRYQAYYVIQGYTRGLAAGIQNITWYALATPNDIYDQSLLYSDFSPKPAFLSYQTLTTELKNYKYERTMTIPGAEAYVFRNNCEGEKIVAWGKNVVLTISPASSLNEVDFMGNVSIVQDGGTGDLDGTKNDSIQIMLNLDPMGSPVVPNPVPIPVFIRVTSK